MDTAISAQISYTQPTDSTRISSRHVSDCFRHIMSLVFDASRLVSKQTQQEIIILLLREMMKTRSPRSYQTCFALISSSNNNSSFFSDCLEICIGQYLHEMAYFLYSQI